MNDNGTVVLAEYSGVARSALTLDAPAPAFTLTFADGRRMALDDLRGKPVVLNFWATWCVLCRTEMPALQAVYNDGEV